MDSSESIDSPSFDRIERLFGFHGSLGFGRSEHDKALVAGSLGNEWAVSDELQISGKVRRSRKPISRCQEGCK